MKKPKKKRENILKETFGTFKFSKPTEKLMREMDRELYPDMNFKDLYPYNQHPFPLSALAFQSSIFQENL